MKLNLLSPKTAALSTIVLASAAFYACGSSGDSPAGSGAGASAGTTHGGSSGSGHGGSSGSSQGGSAGASSGGAAAGGSGAGGGGTGGGSQYIPTEMGLRVAFFGDQSLGKDAKDLLALIRAEQVDMVIHLGDFDYGDNPAAWETFMNEGLGDLPWFAVVGNHDTAKWSGYKAVIQRKLDKISDATCVGEPGVKHSCTYKGFKFVLSGVGLLGSGHEDFLRQELGASSNIWRMCGWHLNQSDMQLGGKGNDTGYKVHQLCQAEGAMIVNGHEHSYARTLALSDVGNTSAGHGATGDWDLIQLMRGRTYVTVNGAGGVGLRDYEAARHDDDTWWSSGYTSNVTIDDGVRTTEANIGDAAGVVVIEFGVDGDARKARGQYRTVGGRLVDEWVITQDPTGYGSQSTGAGGSASGGATSTTGWDPTLCAAFCAKCESCQASPGFSEGDCRYQLSSGFSSADCQAGCAVAQTPAFDPASLPAGWEGLSCSEFDASI